MRQTPVLVFGSVKKDIEGERAPYLLKKRSTKAPRAPYWRSSEAQ